MAPLGVGRGVVGMDILHLIERLENLAVASPRVPMMGKVMIDPQDILDLVDAMRIALPESVRQAQRLVDDQSRRTRPEPQTAVPAELQARLDSHDLVRLAEQRAQEIISQAEREAESLLAEAEEQRRGADQYTRDVLSRLEGQLSGMLTTVQRGLVVLEEQPPPNSRP